jgi:hypothetical protein
VLPLTSLTFEVFLDQRHCVSPTGELRLCKFCFHYTRNFVTVTTVTDPATHPNKPPAWVATHARRTDLGHSGAWRPHVLRDVNATDSPWESARRSFYLVPMRSLDDDRLELYGDDPAFPFRDLSDELVTEIALLRVLEAQMARARRGPSPVRPGSVVRSLPGVGLLGRLVLVAGRHRTGDRFPSAGFFRCFSGLAPNASEPATRTPRASR